MGLHMLPLQAYKQRKQLKLGKKRRESSKRNYYIISPKVIIKAIIIKYNFVGATLHVHTQALWDVLQVGRAPDASLSQWRAQDWVSESKNVARDTVFVAGASSLDGSKSARLHVEHSPLLAAALRCRRHRPAYGVQQLPHVTQMCINPTAALAPMANGMHLDVTCPQHEYDDDEFQD